jgi:hypothetical protein
MISNLKFKLLVSKTYLTQNRLASTVSDPPNLSPRIAATLRILPALANRVASLEIFAVEHYIGMKKNLKEKE